MSPVVTKVALRATDLFWRSVKAGHRAAAAVTLPGSTVALLFPLLVQGESRLVDDMPSRWVAASTLVLVLCGLVAVSSGRSVDNRVGGAGCRSGSHL